MHYRIQISLLFLLLGFGTTLYGQNSRFLIKTNVLTLPQPNVGLELELQPTGNFGIIVGGSTENGLSKLGHLSWFRRGKSSCKVETYSLMGGLAYLHPINTRWEVGGKLLYQYRRTFIYDVDACLAHLTNPYNATFVYGVNSHSVNLLPSARYFATKHLFVEAALGLGLQRSKWNTGEYGKWFLHVPAQLNVGLGF